MKIFGLILMSVYFLFGNESQSIIDDCTTQEQQNLIGNQLDLGQRYCDSNKHIEKKELKPEDIGDEDLKKLQEFIHSFDCDTRKC